MMGKGCEKCNNTGYKGRVGLYEVMESRRRPARARARRRLGARTGARRIEQGMITLRQSGLLKVKAGLTTLEEVARETVK